MSHDSLVRRARMESVLCAIANTVSPPASCHACAKARQRMTCPVPIAVLASARISNVPMLAFVSQPFILWCYKSRKVAWLRVQNQLLANERASAQHHGLTPQSQADHRANRAHHARKTCPRLSAGHKRSAQTEDPPACPLSIGASCNLDHLLLRQV